MSATWADAFCQTSSWEPRTGHSARQSTGPEANINSAKRPAGRIDGRDDRRAASGQTPVISLVVLSFITTCTSRHEPSRKLDRSLVVSDLRIPVGACDVAPVAVYFPVASPLITQEQQEELVAASSTARSLISRWSSVELLTSPLLQVCLLKFCHPPLRWSSNLPLPL